MGNVEHSSPVGVLRGVDEWDGLYVSSRAYMQVINHLEQRAAGTAFACKHAAALARTFRRCTTSLREGERTGRQDRPLRGEVWGWIHDFTVSPILLSSEASNHVPVRARISIVHGLEQRRGRMRDPCGAPPGFLFSDRQGWSGATGGFGSNISAAPIELDGSRG